MRPCCHSHKCVCMPTCIDTMLQQRYNLTDSMWSRDCNSWQLILGYNVFLHLFESL